MKPSKRPCKHCGVVEYPGDVQRVGDFDYPVLRAHFTLCPNAPSGNGMMFDGIQYYRSPERSRLMRKKKSTAKRIGEKAVDFIMGRDVWNGVSNGIFPKES